MNPPEFDQRYVHTLAHISPTTELVTDWVKILESFHNGTAQKGRVLILKLVNELEMMGRDESS